MIERFLEWAHLGLLESDEAQAYFRGRGVSKEQWIRHRLGFVPSEYDIDEKMDPGHNPDICSDWEKRSGWCDSCHFKNWSSTWETPENGGRKIRHVGRGILGSIVLPLTSYSGQSVGFQVRSIATKEYKTFATTKRPEGYFFGIAAALESIWATREVWLVEGAFDQLIVERLVTPNVVSLTTAGPSIHQVRFLRRYVNRVYLCQDLDAPGRRAVDGFIQKYGGEFDCVNVKYSYPGMALKDAGDLWKALGDDRFRRHFERVTGKRS